MLKTLKHAIVLGSLSVTCMRGSKLNKSVVKSEGQQAPGSGEWAEIEGKILVHAELKDSKSSSSQTNVGKSGSDEKGSAQTTTKNSTDVKGSSKVFPAHVSFVVKKEAEGARIRTEFINDGGALFFVNSTLKKQKLPALKSIFNPDDILALKPETNCSSGLSLADSKDTVGKESDAKELPSKDSPSRESSSKEPTDKKCEKWVFIDKKSKQKIVVVLNLDSTNRWVVSSMDYMGDKTFLLEDFTSERAAAN